MKNLSYYLCIFLVNSTPTCDVIFASETYDIAIYGGTSGGVMAAVQGARMGKSVVLIEPGRHLGGMTSSGLGWVDAGSPAAYGGLTKEYFHRIWSYYELDEAWIWEKKRLLADQHCPMPINVQTMWVLEPHVAEKIFDEMIAESGVVVVKNERLNRSEGVKMKGPLINQITMESGRSYNAKIFIDTSYEGDLMAAAGVSYFVGRESNSMYGESSNGIKANIRRGDIPVGLDPYIVMGNPASGLLPRIFKEVGGPDGEEDNGVQAYNYRMCLTDVPENRVSIEKPENYDDREYELIFRAIQRNIPRDKFFKLDLMPNRKTDSNNKGSISTDYIGMSLNYAEADYETRAEIARKHEDWQRGLIWTLQNHWRVPPKVKDFYLPWGLPKDEFIDNKHWPHQLYIREARRMIGALVITENIALGNLPISDGVGLASYSMDSHAIKYFVAADGYIMMDGCLYIKLPRPFAISYQALLPKREQCENLLVPVCLSATHVAFGALRTEPIFMVLGQSAATAACLAIDNNIALQDVSYDKLYERLVADGQKVE